MLGSLLDLIRIGSCLRIFLIVYLCLSIWGHIPLMSPSLLTPALALACLAAGGYALNDHYDVKVDLINTPSRPIPSGRLSQRFALRAGVGFIIAGLGLCALGGPAAAGLGLFDALLLVVYAVHSKRLGWLKTITVCCLHASIFVFVAVVLNRFDAGIGLVAMYTFLSTAFYETIKDERDARGDRAGGDRTPLTLKLDRRKIDLAAHAALAASALLALPLYWFGWGNKLLLILVPCAAFWFYAASKLERKRAEWMKLGIVIEVMAIVWGLA